MEAIQILSKTYLTTNNFLEGITPKNIHYQLSPEELINQSIQKGEGILSDTGALVINTGEFTGRCPEDRFIVCDDITSGSIDWNKFNTPLGEQYFEGLLQKMTAYLHDKPLWVRDCFVCAQPAYRLNIRVVNENPCCNLFAYNMFLRPETTELPGIEPGWHLIQAPRFFGDAASDGVRNKNFVVISFSKKLILIGGTQYTGEMKKAVFTILNYLLPKEKKVLSMHCAANCGKEEDTALFFGLSGTGKTTLSTDSNRWLIGDDEHGWDDTSVFNFEGGCYAKTINLSPEKEPSIYEAIRYGSIVENVPFHKDTNVIDFTSKAITENTRASYPLHFISQAIVPSTGKLPKHIFFLTADAFGVFPLISSLSPGQAMYHFLSGYTAKIAGTEKGVTEPSPTFSACFGAPFIPLQPGKYAEMLGHKISEAKAKVWLVNTGWQGGMYGTGKRIPLAITRLVIKAALNGTLDITTPNPDAVFGVQIPLSCPNVISAMLYPEFSWNNKESYRETAFKLARYFISNFEKYAGSVSKEIVQAGPRVLYS